MYRLYSLARPLLLAITLLSIHITWAGEAVEARLLHFGLARDESLDGLEAFRVLLDEGWRGEGEVEWDMHSAVFPVRLAYRAQSAGGAAEIRYAHGRSYFYSESDLIAPDYGGTLGFSESLAPPTPSEYCLRVLRAGGGEVRDETVRAVYPHRRLAAMRAMVSETMESGIVTPALEAEIVEGTYTCDGKPMAFRACVALLKTTIAAPLSRFVLWDAAGVHLLTAPAAEIEKHADAFAMFVGSAQTGRRWTTAVENAGKHFVGLLNDNRLTPRTPPGRKLDPRSYVDDTVPVWGVPEPINRLILAWFDEDGGKTWIALPEDGVFRLPAPFTAAWLLSDGKILAGAAGYDPAGDGYAGQMALRSLSGF